jgi:hypothetical protein
LLGVDSYTVELDLTDQRTTFADDHDHRLHLHRGRCETFADLVGATDPRDHLNGAPSTRRRSYADNRIR